MNQSQIQTRSHNYLRTRSGKRYFRDVEPDNCLPVVYHASKKPKTVQFDEPEQYQYVEEPETLPIAFMEVEEMGFQSDTSLPTDDATFTEEVSIHGPTEEAGEAAGGTVTVNEVPFDQWENTVRTALRQTFQMTDEELQEYPFYNWFLGGHDPIEVANSIKRDFFRDEDDLYRQPFLDWRHEVDTLLRNKMSMGILDIPEFPYYDCFMDMKTPIEMVNYIIPEFLY